MPESSTPAKSIPTASSIGSKPVTITREILGTCFIPGRLRLAHLDAGSAILKKPGASATAACRKGNGLKSAAAGRKQSANTSGRRQSDNGRHGELQPGYSRGQNQLRHTPI